MDEELKIVDVWSDNLEDAFERIRDVLEHYPYVSIDTEFPGIVAKPTSYQEDYNYQTVKCNVDLLKIIQLGLTFADADGQTPSGVSTWQFNFKFDLQRDMYAYDSIELLKESGIDFEKHLRKGIDVAHFGELIIASGLVMNEDVVWVSFHGSYDFAYVLKLLTCTSLPANQSEFFDLLHDFFPSLYDIKFLLDERSIKLSGRSSLQRISEHLDVKRIGPQHQAGSDSLVTCRTFFKLMQRYFENELDDEKYQGVIYGLGKASAQLHGDCKSDGLYNTPTYAMALPYANGPNSMKWGSDMQAHHVQTTLNPGIVNANLHGSSGAVILNSSVSSPHGEVTSPLGSNVLPGSAAMVNNGAMSNMTGLSFYDTPQFTNQ
ncbi:CAF1 family ribonuclease containing protein, putative [Babesia bigemina]|uniref:poly(A)-specific ribonuclease n=1 Tax=Babesia bigemina TaxID=5866 RepID=A0A061D837_BABBI|nr:CAF1 family ribonuclease containing protein, putative [Babesia bigemina]CDR96826.1 CAF1 family ribonuclease containing protein, putative [Babesia bigemina]|eukprot:XP_012769012.1 CAF1 family ribonuclease containing protein, putative [Babesia bigemina]